MQTPGFKICLSQNARCKAVEISFRFLVVLLVLWDIWWCGPDGPLAWSSKVLLMFLWWPGVHLSFLCFFVLFFDNHNPIKPDLFLSLVLNACTDTLYCGIMVEQVDACWIGVQVLEVFLTGAPPRLLFPLCIASISMVGGLCEVFASQDSWNSPLRCLAFRAFLQVRFPDCFLLRHTRRDQCVFVSLCLPKVPPPFLHFFFYVLIVGDTYCASSENYRYSANSKL